MALKIWLPFTADANNRGTADCTLKSGSLSLVNSPLMKGQSLSNRLDYYSSELVGLKTFTLSFFAQVTSCNDWDDICRIEYAFGDFRFEGSNKGNNTGWYNGNDTSHPVTNSNHAWSSGKTWHHYAVVCDQSKVYSYYDGVLAYTDNYQSDSTKVSSMNGRFRIGQGPTITGGISDFRIYDEPLSKRVIHEISKGLMTHYVLDNVHGGPENYALGTNTTTVNWSLNEQYIGWTSSTYTDDSGVIVTKLTRSSSGNETGWNVLEYNRLNVSALKAIPDTDITVSFDFRCSKPTGEIRIEMLTGSGTNPIANGVNTSAGGVANKWVHIKATLHTVTAANMPTTGGQDLYISRIAKDAGAVFEMKNLIIVKGNADVPWHPAPSDTFYTALGFNSNTISDESGLGSDATGTGSSSEPISVSNNTFPVSNIAAHLDGKSYFTFPTHFTTGQQVSQLSLACYVYITANNNIISLGGNSFIRFRPSSSGTEILYTDTSGGVIANKTVSGDIGTNKWRHVCITYKDGIFKQYLDGVLSGSLDATANGKYMTCGENITGYIGCYIANSETMTGYVSDVRIYGTCLNATDVADLYNTTASIDNYGNLVTYGAFNEDI